jgi:hypothetical protein
VSHESKSALQIIAVLQEDLNTLKKEFVQDNTSENTGLTNVYKYEEETISFVKSKSWTKANQDFHKKISLKNIFCHQLLSTAKRFEIRYNVDKDGTQLELDGKRLPIQFLTDNPANSDHRNQQPLINDLTYGFPLLLRG